MRLHKHNDERALWALLGIAIVAGFIGGRLEWRHNAVASGAIDSASAITAVSDTSTVPHFILGFAGDISIDNTIAANVKKNDKGDYSQLFANTDFLQSPTVTFANLAGPASDKGADTKVSGSIRMNPGIIPALKSAGVDVISLANSHAEDWGRPAFEDTITRLQKNGVLVCGAGMNKTDASTPAVIQEDNYRIGYLCFSDTGPADLAASASTSGILLANDPDFDTIVTAAAHGVNALVVSFDWGTPGQATHSSEQEQLADKAIDDGAAMVVGYGPQVPQEIDEYHGKPVVYSLGSFLFDQSASKTPLSGTFVTAALTGPIVTNVTPQPVVLDKNFVPSLQPPSTDTPNTAP